MESIKHEVSNTKRNYAEDFNYLGRFSLISFWFFKVSCFSFYSMRFLFIYVAIHRNEV